jgi:ankyrin repeat protein
MIRVIIFLSSATLLAIFAMTGIVFQTPRGNSKNSNIHQKLGFIADEYFHDSNVIELCYAIEDNDLRRIKELIAAGVDVNARGKNNVTPLFWSYLDNKLDRFKLLLERGADPNIKLTGSIGKPPALHSSASVTLESITNVYPEFIDEIFAHGGDANIRDDSGHTPLTQLCEFTQHGSPYWRHRVQLLVDNRADLNDGSINTPVLSKYLDPKSAGEALYLLQRGADPFTPLQVTQRGNSRSEEFPYFVQSIVWRMGDQKEPNLLTRIRHRRLLEWLDMHGLNTEEARQDEARLRTVRPYQNGRPNPEYDVLHKQYAARIDIQKRNPKSYFETFGIQAEKCFGDPQVIELCKAIEAKDEATVNKLVANNVDVNFRGKDNLTPLMWAFLGNDLQIFNALLQHGADPSIRLTGDGGCPSTFSVGQSVQSRCLKTALTGYFESIVSNPKFDPNLRDEYQLAPIQQVATFFDNKNMLGRLKLLLDAGSKVEDYDEGTYPPQLFAFENYCYGECLWMLQNGAEIDAINPNDLGRLRHMVVRILDLKLLNMDATIQFPFDMKKDFDQLVAFLERDDAGLLRTRKELEQWHNIVDPKNPDGKYRERYERLKAEIDDKLRNQKNPTEPN